MLKFANQMGAKGKALIFFKVHALVEHFEATKEVLESVWEKDAEAVIKSFEFITNNQLFLWSSLFKELNTCIPA